MKYFAANLVKLTEVKRAVQEAGIEDQLRDTFRKFGAAPRSAELDRWEAAVVPNPSGNAASRAVASAAVAAVGVLAAPPPGAVGPAEDAEEPRPRIVDIVETAGSAVITEQALWETALNLLDKRGRKRWILGRALLACHQHGANSRNETTGGYAPAEVLDQIIAVRVRIGINEAAAGVPPRNFNSIWYQLTRLHSTGQLLGVIAWAQADLRLRTRTGHPLQVVAAAPGMAAQPELEGLPSALRLGSQLGKRGRLSAREPSAVGDDPDEALNDADDGVGVRLIEWPRGTQRSRSRRPRPGLAPV